MNNELYFNQKCTSSLPNTEKTKFFYSSLTLYFLTTYLFSACRGVAAGEAGSTQTRISIPYIEKDTMSQCYVK